MAVAALPWPRKHLPPFIIVTPATLTTTLTTEINIAIDCRSGAPSDIQRSDSSIRYRLDSQSKGQTATVCAEKVRQQPWRLGSLTPTAKRATRQEG